MNTALVPVVLGVAGAVISGLAAYFVAKLPRSGKIQDSTPESLWEEGKAMRAELRAEATSLREELAALKHEMVTLREEAMQRRVEVETIRQEALDLRVETATLRAEMVTLRAEATLLRHEAVDLRKQLAQREDDCPHEEVPPDE